MRPTLTQYNFYCLARCQSYAQKFSALYYREPVNALASRQRDLVTSSLVFVRLQNVLATQSGEI